MTLVSQLLTGSNFIVPSAEVGDVKLPSNVVSPEYSLNRPSAIGIVLSIFAISVGLRCSSVNSGIGAGNEIL